MPNITREGTAGGGSPPVRQRTRRPTTLDVVVGTFGAGGGVIRFVVRHPVILLAVLVVAAVAESGFFRR